MARRQIGKVLRHVRDDGRPAGVNAFIFVGDAVEEAAASLYDVAGELGLFGIKGFMFQEGENIGPAQVFQEIARLTGGAYGVFDASAPARLAALLSAAAAMPLVESRRWNGRRWTGMAPPGRCSARCGKGAAWRSFSSRW